MSSVQRLRLHWALGMLAVALLAATAPRHSLAQDYDCLLYTSDAADEL